MEVKANRMNVKFYIWISQLYRPRVGTLAKRSCRNEKGLRLLCGVGGEVEEGGK
jgi:hypothetical protein